ncbi:hypothetical protein DFP73DRAFT_600345 [Morchella snyderi]|nr:hypothetical protein DFP73DRAFT_600345 [Morchella snyderi]
MASKRASLSLQGGFVPVIFGNQILNYSLCVSVYTQLERDPSALASLFTDDDLLLKLLSSFDQYASRLTELFSQLKRGGVDRAREGTRRKTSASPGIADELIESVLFPLLGQDFSQLHRSQTFLDLFASIVGFCLPFRSRALEELAKRLLEKDSLLEALISGDSSSRAIIDWANIFQISIFDPDIIAGWTRRLTTQCRRCQSSHDVSEHIETWQKLEALIGRLSNIIYDLPKTEYAARDFRVGRVLGRDEKKSDTIRNSRQETIEELPLDVRNAIKDFGLLPPKSAGARALDVFRDQLQKEETLKILQALSASFPCRPCYESATNPSAGRSYQRYDMNSRALFGWFQFTQLHGGGIGIWKVLISSHALEDVELARRSGHFDQVQTKLFQLATGHWQGNELCKNVGDTRGTLYSANYGRNGAILWQKDIDFDEGSGEIGQVIKVWRIAENSMVRNRNLASSPRFPDKFYMVTQTLLDNCRLGITNVEYPLVLSEEELNIIKSTEASTLILGRSGTGKTTCLIYKLFGRYVTAGGHEAGRPRQVLLTRSNVLSDKLEQYTKRLISTKFGERDLDSDERKDHSNFIAEGDKEVNDTVFSVSEECFPLVCTFSHFMKLLENTIRAANRKDFSMVARPDITGRASKLKSNRIQKRLYRRPQNVDFDVFKEEYWPSFPNKLTKGPGISVTLAFMEIIGVIKGSAWTSTTFSPLSRTEYVSHGHRISPVSLDRNALYDIYQRYEDIKSQFKDVDDIDRATAVLEAISKNQVLGKRLEGVFDEIYVDEVQDQRLLELMILLSLIKNPNRIHFAGDTAQSISKDSVFQFKKIKDLIYARFPLASTAIPEPYELYKNYRTHQGILSVATSVMKLLYTYFAEFVDHLPDEIGQFSGPRPTVFVGFDAAIFSARMFGAGDLDDDNAQFGAEQVIIVRDIAEKKELKATIGNFALVLTILESKGMEFEDVVLYNFFTSSDHVRDFQAATNLTALADFDEGKHIALCSELKQLYVAITRAQNRLWFFEKDEGNLKPMLNYWTAGNPLVHLVYSSDNNIQEKLNQLRPGTKADPKIWSGKGYELIYKKDYENFPTPLKALFCFGRAKDNHGTSLAKAFIAEKSGKAFLASGDEDAAEGCLLIAIDLFHHCRLPIREATCYETLGKFKEAADIFSQSGEYGRAADLYNKINHHLDASRNYCLAQRYDEGASTLARGTLFDDLVIYLDRNASFLDDGCRSHYSRLCNLLLKRGKIKPELKDLTLAALQSDEEKEEFFLQYEMTSQLSRFYIDRQRYSEACKLAIKDGYLDKAWELNEEYGGMEQLSEREKLDVFNYTKAKILLATLSKEPEQVLQPETHQSTECSWLPDHLYVLRFWEDLPRLLNDLLHRKQPYDKMSFSRPWTKQIFNIIVTFKAKAFIHSAKTLSELPVESINEVLRMATEMVTTATIPTALLILLRVSPIGLEAKEYRILDPSPLLEGWDLPPSGLSGIKDMITKWVLSQVCRAAKDLDEKARVCRRPQCLYSHEQITPERFSARINDVLRVNSVYGTLLPLYLRFTLSDTTDSWAFFRGSQRRWLENLLAITTYLSSVEHDPRITVCARRALADGKSPHFGVWGGLERLSYHRLDKNWDQMWDFSSMLEQIQLAETLGVSGFERSLRAKTRYQGPPHARLSWDALQRIESCIWFDINLHSVKAVDEVIRAVDTRELFAYHAVISLYERMATYLIYKGRPTEFLLPTGWVEMYLRAVLQRRNPAERNGEHHKTDYREALVSLVQSFCSLIARIDSLGQFQHTLTGTLQRSALSTTRIARRNADFLATCLVNSFACHASTGGQAGIQRYTQMRNSVMHVFGLQFAFSPVLRQCTSEYSLVRELIRSFGQYDGKDSLCLIISSENLQHYFFSFIRPIVSTVILDTLRASENSQHNVVPKEAEQSVDTESLGPLQTVLPAVKVIQHMWRTRFPIFQKRREFCKSPFGQAITYMQRVCSSFALEPCLDRREKIWRTGVLLSDGVDVYLYVREIEKRSLEKKDDIKSRIDNGDSSHMERYQFQWERVSLIRDQILQSAGFLLERNWHKLNIPPQKLKLKFRRQLEVLRSLDSDMAMIELTQEEITATVVIQRVWRTRYPIVLKRRQFAKTTTGLAVKYIRRMCKSVRDNSCLDPKERTRSAIVLFMYGMNIYENVSSIKEIYLKARKSLRSQTKDRSLSLRKLANEKLKRFVGIRDDVRRNADFLAEGNWKELDLTCDELDIKCQATLRSLHHILSNLNHLIAMDEM